jgi:4-amino-4-deoxy-L-arabinose transferase-like glycosyltransferase
LFLDRLLDALSDPKVAPWRRERTAALLLVGYCGVWTLYGVLAKSSQDIHFDMGEMVAWSREALLGTPKHPPFGAWLVRAWFGIFPLSDWSYYLFAMVVATVALWIAWRIAARYLDGEKRVAGLALLTLVPFFNFHAFKFNANTVMLPLWAATTWAFLRSYETRHLGIAALAGVAAAAAMLGKYWSITLLVGLGLAALADPRRRAYFTSAAPWVTVLAGFAALLPHLAWLHAHAFATWDYARASHPGSVADALRSSLGYVAGMAAYIALPVLLAGVAARPTPAALRDTLWPHDPRRRLVLLAFVLPFVVPLLLAVAAREVVASLWAIGGAALLPVVLLSSPKVAIPRVAVKRLLALAIAVPIVAAVLAPAIALVIHRQGVPNHAAHYRLLAQEVDKAWRQATDKPLHVIGSYNNLLYGILIYLPGPPAPLEIVTPSLTPWIDAAAAARDGIALICPVDEDLCLKALDKYVAGAPAARRSEVEVSRRFFGVDSEPERFVIAIVPPRE